MENSDGQSKWDLIRNNSIKMDVLECGTDWSRAVLGGQPCLLSSRHDHNVSLTTNGICPLCYRHKLPWYRTCGACDRRLVRLLPGKHSLIPFIDVFYVIDEVLKCSEAQIYVKETYVAHPSASTYPPSPCLDDMDE